MSSEVKVDLLVDVEFLAIDMSLQLLSHSGVVYVTGMVIIHSMYTKA
jgi:hypothetical protein